jgi:hypothetical protein
MEHIEEIIKRVIVQNEQPITTGIKFLDDAIGGYYPGEMTTICGEECCCKTAFVIHQVCRIAIDQKIPTIVLLNYMTERNFLSLMIAYYCNIEINVIHSVLYSKKYKEIVNSFLNKLKESPLYVAKVGWYEDKSITEAIDNFIVTEKIKIMFMDEAIFDLTPEDTRKLSCMRDIAVKRNIPAVVTCCIWNLREGVEGARPSLVDLGNFSYLHGHDVVIGFTNYEQHGIVTDEHGSNLRGMIGIEILKYRGKLREKNCYIPKDYFYIRDQEQKRKQSLEELKESEGVIVESLIKKLDLSIEDCEQLLY